MVIAIGDREFEVNSTKLDTIFKGQKAQFIDVIDHYKQKHDIQGLIFVIFSIKAICESVMEELVETQGLENVIDMIYADTEQETKGGN